MTISVARLEYNEKVLADPRAGLWEEEEPSDDDITGRNRRRRRSELRERQERDKKAREAAERREQARKERRQKEEEEEKKRQLEEATRGERTVMVTNVNLKATEKDVYGFFKAAGSIRDIQVIRDARSGRSKGVAYVEFYQQETVSAACQMTGQVLMLQPVRVQPSQAEKNRASIVARAALMNQAKDPGLKLYVSGLDGALAAITEDDLKKLFAPFAVSGNIEFIDLHRDPYTNKSKGYAYIKFEKATEGREAIAVMNGFKHSMMGDQEISVGVAQDQGGPLMLTAGAAGTAQQQAADNPDSATKAEPEPERRPVPEEVPGLITDASEKLRLLIQNDNPLPPAGASIFGTRDIMRDHAMNTVTDDPDETMETGLPGEVSMSKSSSTAAVLFAAGQVGGQPAKAFDPSAPPSDEPPPPPPPAAPPAQLSAIHSKPHPSTLNNKANNAASVATNPGLLGVPPPAALVPPPGTLVNPLMPNMPMVPPPGMMVPPPGMLPGMMSNPMMNNPMMGPPGKGGPFPGMNPMMPHPGMMMPPGGKMGGGPMPGMMMPQMPGMMMPGKGMPGMMPNGMQNNPMANMAMAAQNKGGMGGPGSSMNASAGASAPPARKLVLHNLVVAEDDKETREDVEEDVHEEAEKSGPIDSLKLQGDVLHILFKEAHAASDCYRVMNGRLFAGRTIKAELLSS
ncbi:unnamed protein product [Amoebophrya sp. A120]|nr:unnamed protein product [Amoebophrya sp. A120]|eukprot:GSA120T00002971001.1